MDLEWLCSMLSSDLYYNVTFLVSVLSCNGPPAKLKSTDSEDGADGLEDQPHNAEEENKEPDFIRSFFNLFNFGSSASLGPVITNEEESHDHCSSVVQFDFHQSVSAYSLWFTLLILVMILTLVVLVCVVSCFFHKKTSQSSVKDGQVSEVESDSKSAEIDNLFALDGKDEGTPSKAKSTKHTKFDTPLTVKIPKNEKSGIKHWKRNFSTDEILEATVGQFLKELDQGLGLEMSLSSNKFDLNTSLPASSSSDTVSMLTSPRMARRGLRRSQHSSQSLSSDPSAQKQVNEVFIQTWLTYDSFKTRMKWVFPEIGFEGANLGRQDDKLTSLFQFLHQNCPIRPQQWAIAVSVVNYSLFVLEQQIKSLSSESQDMITFSRFESTGSASNGTLIGAADRFEILLVMDLSKCSEFSLLHNNMCEDIPAGHIVLGLKDVNASTQSMKCVRKACIENVFGFYLLTQQVEDFTDSLLKKAVATLNRDHKNKMDRLPFKFQLSANKKLELTYDTRLLQGLGLGLSEIVVKLTPAISLPVPQFCMLPPIYAVPSWRCNHKDNSNSSSATRTVYNRIFRDQGNSDLLWQVYTDRVETAITEGMESKLLLSGSKPYNRECLMILKALFSQGNKNKLLNKGEIDASVLSTVVNFLMIESPPSAWNLDSVGDRVSDAIHFLKSAFENVWLPKFVVHNPHLSAQVPCLEAMSSILSGRQQNILANFTNDAAMKVLDYIEQRLQETGLRKCMKQEFSSHMWEYEFFMFG